MLNRLKDVFASFEQHDVHYVVIGGIAAVLHLEFARAWSCRETMVFEGQHFFVAAKADLIASKKASGRDVDFEDVRLLELTDEGRQ